MAYSHFSCLSFPHILDFFFSKLKNHPYHIIDVALRAFSANGYKKTSTSDIANAAGISKAMVFHYFGSKKALYLYLIEYCGTMLKIEISDKLDSTVTDFFERIKMLSNIEILLMKKHPAILSFLSSIYFEKDEEVKNDIKAILSSGDNIRNEVAFVGIDMSKFKDSINPELVMKMLYWIGEGYAARLSCQTEVDYDASVKEMADCLNLLKNNLYKTEYI